MRLRKPYLRSGLVLDGRARFQTRVRNEGVRRPRGLVHRNVRRHQVRHAAKARMIRHTRQIGKLPVLTAGIRLRIASDVQRDARIGNFRKRIRISLRGFPRSRCRRFQIRGRQRGNRRIYRNLSPHRPLRGRNRMRERARIEFMVGQSRSDAGHRQRRL